MTAYQHSRRRRPTTTSLSGRELRSRGPGRNNAGAIALPDAGGLLVRGLGGSCSPVRLRVAVAAGVVCVAGALAVLLAGGSGVSAPAPALRAQGLSALPLAAHGPVSAGLGTAQAGYGVLGLRAVNRAQRLRLRFSSAGVTVASGSAWTRLSLVGFGRGGVQRAVAASQPVGHGNRVRYPHAGFDEWYANGPLGLEQGFTVARRPDDGVGPVVVSLSVAGNLHPRREGNEVLLSGAGAQLRYGGLWSVDARGRPLRSSLSVRGHRLMISVDDRGARYPLRIDPFVQQGSKLVGSGATGNAHQGYSLALSGDGNTALIGGPYDNAGGAAWVFTRSGSTWTQQGPKLTGFDADGNAGFGQSVALSSDGNTALIGGPGDQLVGGAAWLFTRSGSTWTQQGPKLIGAGYDGNAQQGTSVALSGDGKTALIGGPHDDRDLGATWVFTRSGSSWTQQGSKLVGSPPGTNSLQGWSVALSGDGNTALIGGINYIGGGAAWIFTRAGSAWSQAGSQLLPTPRAGTTLFGRDVALSADGNTALIGAPGARTYTGAGFVFVPYNGNRSLWVQQAELVGAGPYTEQGWGVGLSADGNTALIGGPGGGGLGSDGAYLYTRAPATPLKPPSWSQQGSKLVGSGATIQPSQGWSVALSGDASTALIGGPGDNNDTGATWAFGSSASATPPVRPKLRLAIAGRGTVRAGNVAGYRITVSRTQLKGTRASVLRNVRVTSTHAGRRVGHWRLARLAPRQKRTVRLRVRVPAGARGSFCITTRATAPNARPAIVRRCTRVRRRGSIPVPVAG